ncbi:hypothetical protein [Alkalihalobacillus sp. R86527]
MSRQKKGNTNTQRNNNEKKMQDKQMPSFAEIEAQKLKNPQG